MIGWKAKRYFILLICVVTMIIVISVMLKNQGDQLPIPAREQNSFQTEFTDEDSTGPDVKSRTDSRYAELQGKSSATASTEDDSNVHVRSRARNITLDMMTRKAVLQDVCAEAGFGYSPDRGINNLLVNEEKRILFCAIAKVGCTNVERVFLGLAGIVNMSQLASISGSDVHFKYHSPRLGSFREKKKAAALKTYKKAILVREPLERLLSAFNNKFFHPSPRERNLYVNQVLRFYDNHPILRSNRTIYDVLKTKPMSVTFSQFIQYMADCIDYNVTIMNMNVHFKEFWRVCDPCKVKYDYIGKYETLEEDTDYMFDKMSIDVKFPNKSGGFSKTPTRLLVDAAYAKVPRYNIQKIYSLYEKDYRLFGYPLPKVLKDSIL